MPENRSRLIRQVGTFASIPMVLAGGPTLGFLMGRFLDRRFGTDPWGIAIAVLIGFIAGVVQTIRLVQDAQRKSDSTNSS